MNNNKNFIIFQYFMVIVRAFENIDILLDARKFHSSYIF